MFIKLPRLLRGRLANKRRHRRVTPSCLRLPRGVALHKLEGKRKVIMLQVFSFLLSRKIISHNQHSHVSIIILLQA